MTPEEKLNIIAEQIQDIRSAIENFKSDNINIHQRLNLSESKLNSLNQDAINNIKGQISDEINDLNSEINSLKIIIPKDLDKIITDIECRIPEGLNSQIKNLKENNSELIHKINSLEKDLVHEIKTLNIKIENLNNTFNDKHDNLNSKIDRLPESFPTKGELEKTNKDNIKNSIFGTSSIIGTMFIVGFSFLTFSLDSNTKYVEGKIDNKVSEVTNSINQNSDSINTIKDTIDQDFKSIKKDYKDINDNYQKIIDKLDKLEKNDNEIAQK